MTGKKRLLSILVAVLMVLAMMPATAAPVFAEEETVRFCVGVYDLTNSRSGEGGTYTFGDEDMTHTLDWHTVPAGTKVTLVAVPAEGYRFEGWAYGNVSGEGDEMTIRPEIGDFFISTENSLSVQPFTEYDDGYCAVFREINDSQPDIDFSTLKILPPEERQSDRIVTAGDKINISVKITDNGKVNLARAIFVHSDYQYQIIAQMVNLHKQENDIWTGVFEINDRTKLGVWNLGYIEAEDDNNNNLRHFNNKSYYGYTYSPNDDLSEYDFSVNESYKVTFNSRGGSEIPEQTVISGKKAKKPEDPTKEGRYFNGWYKDEGLTESYWFSNPVTDNITLYASWVIYAGIGVYNESNPDNYRCGTVDITSESTEYNHSDVTTMNYTLPEDESVTFTAKPAEGYTFKGWYEGVYGDSHFIETPSDTLISAQNPYTPASPDEAKALCAVFECTEHDWQLVNHKATFTEHGYQVTECSVCGARDGDLAIGAMPVDTVKLAKTSYVYTGKAIKPAVTLASSDGPLSSEYYTVRYSNNTKAGTATVTVTLKGDYYEGTKDLTFKITKAPNPLTVKPKTATVYYSKLKKSSQTLAASKYINFTKKLNDKKTYTISSVKKGTKSYRKSFTINKSTGKLTVKKGLKKGTYKVKVKVKALGSSNYKASTEKTVTSKVIVK